MRFSMTNVVVFNDIQLLFRILFTIFISTKWKLKEIIYCIIPLKFLHMLNFFLNVYVYECYTDSSKLSVSKWIQNNLRYKKHFPRFDLVRKQLHLQSIQSLLKYQIHFLSFISGSKSTYIKHRCLLHTDSTKTDATRSPPSRRLNSSDTDIFFQHIVISFKTKS